MEFGPLLPSDDEPEISDPGELREHRRRRLVLAYRLFGALRWGHIGDGHISARDPERPDHFWLIRYGVAFNHCTIDDIVLVGPDATVVEGGGDINFTAWNIHWPILMARPDLVSAAHTHTPWGTPFSAEVRPIEPISQEACGFFEAHAIFDDEEVEVRTLDGGKRIAEAIGHHRAMVLRNHGLLTAGASVDEAVGRFVMMERVTETAMKARHAKPISRTAALEARERLGSSQQAWQIFNWLIRTHLP